LLEGNNKVDEQEIKVDNQYQPVSNVEKAKDILPPQPGYAFPMQRTDKLQAIIKRESTHL